MNCNFALSAILLGCSAIATAETRVASDPGSGNVFLARNTGSLQEDGVALRGDSRPAAFYGIGVYGTGSFIGVQGEASGSGVGNRTGLYGYASGGASENYGVFGYAYGGTKAYGVYGSAAGGTNNYAGYFAGNVYVSGTLSNPSDSRLKKDVRSLEGALAGIRNLRPSTYLFDTTRVRMRGLPHGRQIGLLADDVKAAYPELVVDVPVSDSIPSKSVSREIEMVQSVNYIGLIPVLVRAIQEQQAEIEALKAALGAQSSRK